MVSVGLKDHPRVCGEKVQILLYTDVQKGSPPRMRGKEIRLSSQSLFSGITPAYAGKSTSEKLYALGLKDHPRVCGEKTKKIP